MNSRPASTGKSRCISPGCLGGWSTTVIGRFYNGRDHSTVCHGIQRIESLRESNPDVDVLIAEFKQQLDQGCEGPV
jgi:hypothetical protein